MGNGRKEGLWCAIVVKLLKQEIAMKRGLDLYPPCVLKETNSRAHIDRPVNLKVIGEGQRETRSGKSCNLKTKQSLVFKTGLGEALVSKSPGMAGVGAPI